MSLHVLIGVLAAAAAFGAACGVVLWLLGRAARRRVEYRLKSISDEAAS